MAKPIEDLGHCAVATKPLRIKRYDPGRLPDPAQCVDCLIIVNDRADGNPRGRLVLSNGASWDHFAWLSEIGQPVRQPAQIDLVPVVRDAVAQMLPSLGTPYRAPVLPAGNASECSLDALAERDKTLAAGLLEMSEHINRIMAENADLMARVEFLERHALARAELRGVV